MKPERREALLQRREAMHLANDQKQQRASIASALDALERAGVSHEVLWSERKEGAAYQLSRGDEVLARWPMTSSGVSWDRVPGASFRTGAGDRAGGAAVLGEVLTEVASAPDEKVIVAWPNAASPELSLTAAAAAEHAHAVLGPGGQLWICGTAAPWLIEYRPDVAMISSAPEPPGS
jgi:hypothetical protein